MKETPRHQADFVAKGNADGQPSDVAFGSLIFGADDQPVRVKQLELPGSAVVVVVSRSDDIEQIMQNIVIDAPLRDPQ